MIRHYCDICKTEMGGLDYAMLLFRKDQLVVQIKVNSCGIRVAGQAGFDRPPDVCHVCLYKAVKEGLLEQGAIEGIPGSKETLQRKKQEEDEAIRRLME